MTSSSNQSIWRERCSFHSSVRQPITSGYFHHCDVKCVLSLEHVCLVHWLLLSIVPSNSFSFLSITAWRRLIKAHLTSFWSSTALSGVTFSHCKNEMLHLYVVNSPIKSAKLSYIRATTRRTANQNAILSITRLIGMTSQLRKQILYVLLYWNTDTRPIIIIWEELPNVTGVL